MRDDVYDNSYIQQMVKNVLSVSVNFFLAAHCITPSKPKKRIFFGQYFFFMKHCFCHYGFRLFTCTKFPNGNIPFFRIVSNRVNSVNIRASWTLPASSVLSSIRTASSSPLTKLYKDFSSINSLQILSSPSKVKFER